MKQLFVLCCLFAIAFGVECFVERCKVADDCVDPQSTCCQGGCVLPFPPGATCGDDICGSCRDYCVNGKCTEIDFGCSCTTDADCGSDTTRSFCLAGTCTVAHTLVEGEACQDSKQCFQDPEFLLYCIGSTCRGNQTAGQSCAVIQQGTNCGNDTWCDDSQQSPVCTTRIAVGSLCTDSRECAVGSLCVMDETTFESTCTLAFAIGANCSFSAQCASGACHISTGKCVAAGSVATGEVCDSPTSCVSGSCQIGAANYTQYCYAPASTIPNGEWCNLFADNCIGVCHCNSTQCGDAPAKRQIIEIPQPACIAYKSLEDGSLCQTSLQCKNTCESEYRGSVCYTINSVDEGGECRVDEACKGSMRCTFGVCTVVQAGSACSAGDDCDLNQECYCNGTGNIGVCQVTAESTLQYEFNQAFYQTCPQIQEAVYYRYAGYCGAYSQDLLQAPAFCQRLMAQALCCSGCLLVNATNIYKNLSSIISDYGSSSTDYVVDCATYTVSAQTTECCGEINSTCAFNRDVSSTKNCPGIFSSSSTSASGSRSGSGSGSTSSGSRSTVISGSNAGNSTVSRATTTAQESDADVMRVGMMTIVAILSLFA